MLKIAQLGQPVLRQVASEVSLAEIHSPEFQDFLEAMFETLDEARGAGLAAPQVFVSKRVFLAAIIPPEHEDEDPGIEVFINPRVTFLSTDTAKAWEGCLSFSELLVLVPRQVSLRVEYLNEDGDAQILELEGFPARVIQHEFDHLNGILTLDRAASTLDIIKASEIDAVLGPKDEE